MTFEEMLNRARKSGEERLNQLYELLLEQNRIDDMKTAMKDADFREQLYIEFGLKTKE